MKAFYPFLIIASALIIPCSPVFAQIQIGSTIEGLASGDTYGESVSLSADGSRVAIGMSFDGFEDDDFNGLAQVYELVNGDWEQVGEDILCQDCGMGVILEFGVSVALSDDGNRLAVAAPGSNLVQVFEWTGTAWEVLGGFDTREFGISLSASADAERIGIASGGQGAFVFEFKITEEAPFEIYTQIGQDLNPPDAFDYGTTVSISGDGSRIAVGAGDDGINFGRVDVYEYDEPNDTFISIGRVATDVRDDFTGCRDCVSLSADGNRLAWGNPLSENTTVTDTSEVTIVNPGKIKVVEYDGSAWNQLGPTLEIDSTQGWTLSPDGNRIAVVIGLDTDNEDDFSSEVQVFEWDGISWSPFGNSITGNQVNEFYGIALSFSSDGNQLAIGANSDEGGPSGRVQVYDLSAVTENKNWPSDRTALSIDRLFPNPASDHVTIEYTIPASGIVSIDLFNELGQSVLKRITHGFSGPNWLNWSVSALPAGMYRVRLTSNNKNTYQNLLIME